MTDTTAGHHPWRSFPRRSSPRPLRLVWPPVAATNARQLCCRSGGSSSSGVDDDDSGGGSGGDRSGGSSSGDRGTDAAATVAAVTDSGCPRRDGVLCRAPRCPCARGRNAAATVPAADAGHTARLAATARFSWPWDRSSLPAGRRRTSPREGVDGIADAASQTAPPRPPPRSPPRPTWWPRRGGGGSVGRCARRPPHCRVWRALPAERSAGGGCDEGAHGQHARGKTRPCARHVELNHPVWLRHDGRDAETVFGCRQRNLKVAPPRICSLRPPSPRPLRTTPRQRGGGEPSTPPPSSGLPEAATPSRRSVPCCANAPRAAHRCSSTALRAAVPPPPPPPLLSPPTPPPPFPYSLFSLPILLSPRPSSHVQIPPLRSSPLPPPRRQPLPLVWSHAPLFGRTRGAGAGSGGSGRARACRVRGWVAGRPPRPAARPLHPLRSADAAAVGGAAGGFPHGGGSHHTRRRC